MQIKSSEFILASGRIITKYTLNNDTGMVVEVLDLGATLTKILVPDSRGIYENILLEWEDLNVYETNPGCLGAVIGRVAGRIHNAQITLGEKVYHFTKNHNNNVCHSGPDNFTHQIWKAKTKTSTDQVVLELSYLSVDGQDGFPGNLEARVSYILKNDNTLTLHYEATADQETLVNLTNHAYFNLSGEAKHSILNQEMKINSNKICELDSGLIPTGRYLSVEEESAFNFRQFKRIGQDIEMDDEQINYGQGYDHIWILNEGEECASLYDPESGRLMEVSTTEPVVVVYTMNSADSLLKLSNGEPSQKRMGVCFETQKCAIGHNEVFKEAQILRPSEKYHQTTIFKFTTK